MPPTQTYSQQMMAQLCNDWQASMYNVSTNGHMPFVSGLTYHHPGYSLGVEMQDVNYSRENGRRNNRGRGMRRDYNRAINSTNEMQSGYMGDQAQFHPQIHPIMYIYSDHHSVSTQQHQVAAGQIYYPPPMYSSILHPHPNAQPISSNSHAQPTYPPNPPQMDKCVRQSQPVPLEQSNQETVKQPIIKTQDKHVQSTNIDKSICHQVENNHDSLQTNVINNVIATIVNNSTSESVKSMGENTANKKIITSSEKDVKVPHNIARTENCNGMQVDVSSISTNNDVEMNQNGEMDKTFKNETAANVTTITKTSPKSVPTKAEKNEINIEQNVTLKDAQNNNNIEHKILNESPVTSNESGIPKASSSMSVSTSSSSSSSTTIFRSYASLLKKDSTEIQTLTSCKPTIHIDENNLPKTPTQKESTSLSSTPKNQNDSSSTSNVNDYKPLQNGMLQNCYDDPNSYRIGGK